MRTTSLSMNVAIGGEYAAYPNYNFDMWQFG